MGNFFMSSLMALFQKWRLLRTLSFPQMDDECFESRHPEDPIVNLIYDGGRFIQHLDLVQKVFVGERH